MRWLVADSGLEINTIQWVEGGVAVSYFDSASDARVGGALVKTHQLMISATHPDYREDIYQLARIAERLLANCLEDFDDSEPYEPDVDEDEEADDAPIRGMGDG